MKPEIKHILGTMVVDKMKPAIKKILEMGDGGELPEINDPKLLKMAGDARKARAAQRPMSLEEARAQTPSYKRMIERN